LQSKFEHNSLSGCSVFPGANHHKFSTKTRCCRSAEASMGLRMTMNGHGSHGDMNGHPGPDGMEKWVRNIRQLSKIFDRLPQGMKRTVSLLLQTFAALIICTACALAFGAALGGVQVHVNVLGLELGSHGMEHERTKSPGDVVAWNKNKYTVELMTPSHAAVDQAVKYIKDCYTSFQTKGKQSDVFTGTELASIVRSTAAEDKILYDSIRIHLNYLEALAASYLLDVVNKPTFFESYKDTLSVWHMRYKGAFGFLSTHCNCRWPQFAKLFETIEWKNEILPDGIEVSKRTCPSFGAKSATL